MSTPWGIELNQPDAFIDLIEINGGQLDDGTGFGVQRRR